jgi:hypothetical protein
MRPALPRWLRATLVTTHITTAASWLGTDATLIALTIAGKPIPAVLGAWITTPAAAITLATGITLAAHKPWGLRRHHWIGVKIRIAAIITAAGLTSLTGALDPMTVLTARICALIALSLRSPYPSPITQSVIPGSARGRWQKLDQVAGAYT